MGARNRTPRTLGYARVSSEDGRQDLSLEAQRASLTAAGAVETIADEETGSHADRAGLLALVASARKGDEVLVTKLDRLSRSVADTFRLVETLGARGVRVRSLAEGVCGAATSDETLSLGLRALFAQAERQKIAERTKAALGHKAARGERVSGRVPFGTRLAADGVHLEPEPREAEIMAAVRALRAEGLTVREVVAGLAARGVVGRTGRPLGLAQVHAILTTEAA